jgi:hypothetical protein
MYSETDLSPIVLNARTDYRPSWITVAGLNQSLDSNIRFATFEAEGQLGIHTGMMKHFEGNGLLIARIPHFLGSSFGLALGEGFSLASQNPQLENKAKGMRIGNSTLNPLETFLFLTHTNYPLALADIQFDPQSSRQFLNYMMFEAEYRIQNDEWSPGVFLRIHHRSGVFGLYCPPDPACGSNYVTYGVKWRLP